MIHEGGYIIGKRVRKEKSNFSDRNEIIYIKRITKPVIDEEYRKSSSVVRPWV